MRLPARAEPERVPVVGRFKKGAYADSYGKLVELQPSPHYNKLFLQSVPTVELHSFAEEQNKTENMRFQLVACLLASLAAASPQANRGTACKETAVERLHQGHNHNVNQAKVPGAINLPLPGGSNCWHGKKIGGGE